MIRVIKPANFAFEAAFKMLLMPNPPRELPERYLMELRPDTKTGILFWVTPKAVDMKGMKVIRVLLQLAARESVPLL